MAKKKQIELTIEEKLQNALVPKEEQPYKIPSNWCWLYSNFVVDVRDGTHDTPKYISEGYPLITSKNLKNNNIDFDKVNYISKEDYEKINLRSKVDIGDVLFSMIGTIGNPVLIKGQTNYAIKNVALFKDINLINMTFFRFYLETKFVIDKMKKEAKGSTQKFVSLKYLRNFPICYPSLEEQQRIVNRIESLFAKLDRAKELIENTLTQFEQNKMAILHKAFTGELTAKWRKENNIDLSSWQEKTIDELCTSLKYGTSKKSKPEGSVVVLRMGNLQNGEIDWSNLMYTDDKDDIEKYLLKKGDVLFNRTNSPELVGKTSIYRGEYPAIYAGYLIKLDYGKDIIGEYLNYMMNSTKAKHYCYTVKTDGVSQSNINAKKIGAFEIPVPTIEEQQEIVNILDKLLAKYNKIKNLEQQLEKIELLKKAILAKAFRGELGTNNPDEESAENLLKEILAEK
ncbi:MULTISPECIES: restriction endonuclease subunit S [Megamonas]|uniref:restriction endonuclease subunit S n=1 Tax=Megamonas TaxID=158846 RepID=UPI000E42A95C|nr:MULTISPECIES: restriction endonuclease subunit S [Megamonas]RGO06282.1 restriction endonuclease subunit S [Megamonas rupellensis]